MSWAHIHLALNHVLIIGLPIALLLLAWALYRGSSELTRAALGLIVLLGLVTIVVQLTGEPAEELVEGLPGVLDSAVDRHEDAALVGTYGMTALALLALFGLWRYRTGPALERRLPAALLVGGVFLTGFFIWVANLGGQIRHTELAPQSGTIERSTMPDQSER
jgi:uncharacterized membrane protein